MDVARELARRTSCRGRRWRNRCSNSGCSGPSPAPWCRRRRCIRSSSCRGSGCNRCCRRTARRRRAPTTGQESLIQKHSSIWWIISSMKTPPDDHRNWYGWPGLSCQSSSFSPRGNGPMQIAGIHAIGADELDVAHRAVADLLDQGLAGRGMAAHQPGGDLEVLLLGRFAGAEDALDAARVGGEILLHEHVDALLHGIFQVRRAEGRRGWSAWPRRPGRRQSIALR